MIEIKRVKLIIVLLVFLLTGCSSINEGSGELVKKPKLSDENEDIKKLIEVSLPSNAKLEMIKSKGGYSAIKKIDINLDGKDEILIFYSLETDKKLYMTIFEKVKTSYEKTMEIDIPGNSFKEVIVVDITNSGEKDIVINTVEDLGRKKTNKMNFYSYKNEKPKFFEIEYIEYVINDINNDGKQDVIIFKGENDILVADYYIYNEASKKMEYMNNLKLDYFYKIYEPLVVNITEDRKAILIEKNTEIESAMTLTTLIDLNENSSLRNILKEGELFSMENIKIKEIGNSEVLSVGAVIEFEKRKSRIDQFEALKGEIWYTYDVEEDRIGAVNKKIYTDYDKGVTLKIPNSWDLDRITYSREELDEESNINLYIDDYTSSFLNIKIRKSKIVDNTEGWIEVGIDGDSIYYVKQNKNIPEIYKNYNLDKKDWQGTISIN